MALLHKNDSVGLIALSIGPALMMKDTFEQLEQVLQEMGLNVIWAPKLYRQESVFQASDSEKAEMLMDFYRNDELVAIFDVSGGDLANGVLSYLDYDLMKRYPKPFFGYSDLSVVVNGLYTKTHHKTYLYQIRNLVSEDASKQQQWFKETLFHQKDTLFQFDVEWIQGETLEGELIGGNIRCFLKLAGTPYLPSFEKKILLLESYSGDVAKMATYLNQYKQMGVFEQINGLILGSFTEMEQKQYEPDIVSLVKSIVNLPQLPIVKTSQIGHGPDSKCAIIGERLMMKKEG